MNKFKRQFYDITQFFNKMIPGRKKHMVIAFFACLPDTFFNLLLAFILKNVYSSVIHKNTIPLYRTILFFVLLTAGVFSYNFIFWRLYGSSTVKISGNIKRMIIHKLCLLRLSYLENNHSSDIISILTNDINTSRFLYENIRIVLSSLLLCVISTILVFNTSLYLGVIIGLFGLIQLIINLFVVKSLEKQSKNIRESTKQMNNTFSDILENNMSIRLYCSRDYYIKVCRDINQRLYKSKMKLNIINSIILGINVGFGLLGYIFVLVTGSLLISAGKLTIPDLLFVTQMRLMMVQGILTFGNYTVQMQPAITGIRNILSYMDFDIEENI